MELLALFAFGAPLFWFAVFLFFCAMVWCIEDESNIAAAITLVVGVFVIWWLSGHGVPSMVWVVDHLLYLVLSVLAYVAIGSAWGVLKWWFFLHNRADDYEARKVEYQQAFKEYTREMDARADANRKANPQWVDTRQYTDYKSYLQDRYHFPPLPSENKSRIMLWMVWWPWSAIWTLLNDPLKRLYRFVYQRLVSVYTRMSYAVFGGRFTELQ